MWKDLKLDLEIFERIQPCRSMAGVMYGLPKVHKKGAPIRWSSIKSSLVERTASHGLRRRRSHRHSEH